MGRAKNSPALSLSRAATEGRVCVVVVSVATFKGNLGLLEEENKTVQPSNQDHKIPTNMQEIGTGTVLNNNKHADS
jgi:hypothetical protein